MISYDEQRPLGKVRRRVRIGDFVFVAHDYGEKAERRAHAHDWLHLSIVRRGRWDRSLGGRNDSLRAGSLSLLPAGERHADRYAAGSQCLHIVIPARLQATLEADFGSSARARGELRPAASAACTVAILREFSEPNDESQSAVECLVLDVVSRELSLTVERSRLRPSWLRVVLEDLDDTFEHPWTLNKIATEIGVHPVHLCRAFSDHMHCTLGQYVRELRLLRGWQLLALSPATIANVATQCGFADQSHFTRQFKQRYGMTPGAHRRSAATAPRDGAVHR